MSRLNPSDSHAVWMTKILLVLCVVISVTGFFIIDPEIKNGVVLFGAWVFAGLGWVFAIPMLVREVHAHWSDLKKGNEKIAGIKSIFLTQDVVDQKLANLAMEFRLRCNYEHSLKGVTQWGDNLNSATIEVAKAKVAFWKAHGLAKAHGFRVRGKYTGYLKTA